ncbi:alpha/beta hydrolase [Alphaproteobacteria bacterium]|nr:alpha/beta hydrolase [Alphaproteobacteria bacterium]
MVKNYKNIEFLSDKIILRGRLYLSAHSQLSPFIIMAHGTSANITMGINNYASKFQEAGFNVLLYDHEGMGLSDGEPLVMNPWVQARGYKNACKYINSNKHLYNNKIFLWGESFSGMLVLVVGALIKNISGIIAVTPSCGINIIHFKNKLIDFKKLKDIFSYGNFNNYETDVIGPIPVVSLDQKKLPSLLKPKEAYNWFIASSKTSEIRWKNKITRVLPKTEVPFSSQLTASYIKAPTLIITGKNDEIEQANPIVQKYVYDNIPSPKELIEIDGGHFGCLYPDSVIFLDNLNNKLNFLNKYK